MITLTHTNHNYSLFFAYINVLAFSIKHVHLQELAENGYSEEPGSTHLPSTHSKDSLTWDQRRPITVHFGQVGVGNYFSYDVILVHIDIVIRIQSI